MFCLAAQALEFSKITLVHDLAAIMLVAGFTALLFHSLGWPKVVGYILAGVLIGLPSISPFLISNKESINVLANLGVLFLMFTLGLELNIRRLKKIGGVIFPTAALDLALMLCAGYVTGHYIFKWGMLPSLFLGAVICDSSTTLLAKSLEEIGMAKTRFANVIFGTTISEDILTVGIMALLTGFAITGRFQASELGLQLLYIILFLIGVMVMGILFLPRFLEHISKRCDSETTLLIILGICFGTAFIAEAFQFNLALGAFLIGAVVSESSISLKVHERTSALRSMFSTVFFVTIGLMVDVGELWSCKWQILLLSGIVILCKTINCSMGSFLFGQPWKDSLRTGIGLAQIGDFAYMVALMGITQFNGQAPYRQMYQIAVGVSIITTLLNPFLLRGSGGLLAFLEKRLPDSMLNSLGQWTEYMQRTGQSARRGMLPPDFKKTVVLYAIDLAMLAVLFILGHYIIHLDMLWEKLPAWMAHNLDIIIWLVCCILSLPIMFSTYQHTKKLAREISTATIPAFFNERWANYMRQFTRIIYTSIGLAALALEISLLSISLFPAWPIAVTIVAIFLAIAITLTHFFKKQFKERTRAGQEIILNLLYGSAEEIQQTISTHIYTLVTIPKDSGAIGMTLLQLGLPNRTGATIAQITRADGTVITAPGANETLAAGDVLNLSASKEQHQNTEELLRSKEILPLESGSISTMLKMQLKPIHLQEGFHAIGKSLKELRLRNETGATVVRITYADQSTTDTPSPEHIFTHGDTIYLLGNMEQIHRASHLLQQGQ